MAFVISLFLAWTVKYAFINSWILVKMMSSYMQAVPNTQITFDLYGKLGGLSKKFKELFRKGQDGPNEVKKPNFCPSCGTSLSPDTAFCGDCGMRLEEI